MHSLDFLSGTPKYFIFQKGANKTNLGGILTLVYALIIISIIFVYLYDYFSGNKYIVESSLIEELIDEKQREELLSKNEINPEIKFNINLLDYDAKNLSENFIIRDIKTKKKISRGSFFKSRVSDVGFYIEYVCQNENCEKSKEEDTYFNYWVSIGYQGFTIDHQSKDFPIKNDENLFFNEYYPFLFENILIRKIYWENIRYKEEISGFTKLYYDLIGKEKVLYAGAISKNSDSYILDKGYNYNNKTTRLLGAVKLDIHLDINREYKRKKVSRLDLIANIGALMSSIYSIFAKLFELAYSKNFDNYKIIDKILSKRLKFNNGNESKNKNIKEIELSSNDYKNSINDELSLENNFIINDVDADNNSYYNKNYNINNMESDSTLPKLRFFDFIFNTIYNKRCCCESNKQELLSICNKILLRYNSIDYILYNQIKLENLFKDYKWNNPKLKDIENNDLIISLKYYI